LGTRPPFRSIILPQVGVVGDRWLRRVPLAVGAAMALPLAVCAWIGSFSRYTADDFCWAGVLRTEGFFNAQVSWYTAYSPRYAFTFLVNLVELAGPAIVPALPALAIVVWVAILTWSLRQFDIQLARLPRTASAFVLAELAALATLQTAPDLPQSLYWQTGMLTYLLPLVLATFLIGWIRRGSTTWWALLVSGLVTFVAGGLSETYLIPQNVALTLALLVSVATGRRPASKHFGAALVGGVLALLAILVAPATSQRVGGSPADLWLASSASIATAAYQVLRLVRYFPLTILLCLALPGVLGAKCPMDRKWFLLVSAGVLITVPFCYFPSFYAQNGNPPARSLIVPGAILIGYLIFTGYALAARLHDVVPEPRRLAVALALALVPIGMAVVSLPDQATAAEHAALWDAEDQQIRASRDAGEADLTVPHLPPYLGENFVTSDREDWFNRCVARHYGVRSIASAS
jgi:hypothetical protein